VEAREKTEEVDEGRGIPERICSVRRESIASTSERTARRQRKGEEEEGGEEEEEEEVVVVVVVLEMEEREGCRWMATDILLFCESNPKKKKGLGKRKTNRLRFGVLQSYSQTVE